MKKVIFLFTLSCVPVVFTQAQNVQKKSETTTVFTQQNARPSPDTDGDGVPDSKDKELITPTYCQPVDADGVGKCPDPACCNTFKVNTSSMKGSMENELANQKELLKTQALEIEKLNRKLDELANLINSSIAEKSKLIATTEVLKLTSIPNPTNQSFNIKFESNSKQPLTITVRDIVGKVIEERPVLSSNTTLELGRNYRPGSYFLEARQGKERNSLILIKQ